MNSFTPEQKKAAKRLAVAYQAYHEAIGDHTQDNALVLYGEMLLEAIAETGVEVTSRENIAGLVDCARIRLRRGKEVAI